MRQLLALMLFVTATAFAAKKAVSDEAYAPHTPTLIYYLSAVSDSKDVDSLVASVSKLASVSKVALDPSHRYVQVRFDSHVVSYHQVAIAIGLKHDPRLKITIPEYPGNASKVDAVLAGKRLNQRVKVEPLDKTKGQFLLHFLPLDLDAATKEPQGFNGGHINHPIHDPPPRGLGLTCVYASSDGP